MSLFSRLLKRSITEFLHKWRNWIIAFCLLFMLSIGVSIYFGKQADRVLIDLMTDFVRQKSNGFYRIGFNHIDFLINSRSFRITDFRFAQTNALNGYDNTPEDINYLYEAEIPEIKIKIIDFWSIFILKKLRVAGIELNEPVVKIINLNKSREPKKLSLEAGNMYSLISGHLSELRINDFSIIGGDLFYETLAAPEFDSFRIRNFDFSVRNFLLNATAVRDDGKFLYTDDITLELGEQIILLKDSIHKIEFDKFYISTRANELIFENFRLTKYYDRAESTSHDHYQITLPYFKLSGIDFLSAYHNNHLIIDSIHIPSPDVDLNLSITKTVKKPGKNELLDLIMMYHEKLYVGDFNITNAKVQLRHARETGEINIQTGLINAAMSNIRLDQEIYSQHHYGFDFDQIDLIIKNYHTELPDSAASISVGEICITSNPMTYTLTDVKIIAGDSSDLNKNQIDVKAPFIVLTGFDLPQYINSDSMTFKELYLEQPEILFVFRDSKPRAEKVNSPGGYFGLYKIINSLSPLVAGEKVIVQDGVFSVSHPGIHASAALSKVRLELLDLYVDSLRANSRDVFGGSELICSVGKGNIAYEDVDLEMEKMMYFSSTKNLKIESVEIKNSGVNKRTPDSFQFSNVSIRGIDANSIAQTKKIDLDALLVQQGNIQIYREPKDSIDNQIKIPELETDVPLFIKNVSIEKTDITYRLKDQWAFKAKDGELKVTELRFIQSHGASFFDRIDFEKIVNIGLDDYSFLIENKKHLLEINKVRFESDGEVKIDSLKLSPYGPVRDRFNVAAPSIRCTGIDLKRVLRNSYYSGKEIIIENPVIDLSITSKENQKISSLDLNYIPLLMRKGFYGLKTDLFQVIDASVNIETASDSVASVLECDLLNLDILDFEVDSTKKMAPDRFLFSHNVVLHGDYISLYQPVNGNFLGVNHVDISTLEKNIFLEGLLITTNNHKNTGSTDKLKLSLDHLDFINIDLFKLTQNHVLKIDRINLTNASLKISPANKANGQSTGKNKRTGNIENGAENIDSLFPSGSNYFGVKHRKPGPGSFQLYHYDYLFDTLLIKNVDIGQCLISGSDLSVENPAEGRTNLRLPDIWFLAEGIRYNPVSARDSTRILYSDHVTTKLGNLHYNFPDKLNSIRVDEIIFNSSDSSMLIKYPLLEPLVNKYNYGPAKGYQSTWMRIENDSIRLQGIDFLKMINNGILNAKSLSIHKADFEIYRDKRVPFPEWQLKPLPQTAFNDLDFTVSIDSVKLIDSYISYLEQTDKTSSPGEVSFYNLDAKIINITNDSIRIARQPATNISATTRLYNKALINAQFQFDMLNPDQIHTYGVNVDSIDLTEFNRILVPTALTQIKTGKSKRIVMTARANENYSYGEMRFFYNDLKVQLLNPETETSKGLGNVLGSFFANTFIIRTNNPKNFVLRKGDIFFERDEKRAIFNYWTKTFLSGVVSSIGATNNKKKIRKMQKQALKELKLKQDENQHLDR